VVRNHPRVESADFPADFPAGNSRRRRCRSQGARRRYRHVFSQGWIAAENFIDSKNRAVHLPKGIGELLFVCHRAPSGRRQRSLEKSKLELPTYCSAIFLVIEPRRCRATNLIAHEASADQQRGHEHRMGEVTAVLSLS
jgi:hypothetical protein